MLSLYLFFPFRGNFLYEAPWARLQQLAKSNKEIQGWTVLPRNCIEEEIYWEMEALKGRLNLLACSTVGWRRPFRSRRRRRRSVGLVGPRKKT